MNPRVIAYEILDALDKKPMGTPREKLADTIVRKLGNDCTAWGADLNELRELNKALTALRRSGLELNKATVFAIKVAAAYSNVTRPPTEIDMERQEL